MSSYYRNYSYYGISSGESDRDGWRIGDKIQVRLNYNNTFVDNNYNTHPYMGLELYIGNQTIGYCGGAGHFCYSQADILSTSNGDSINIFYEDPYYGTNFQIFRVVLEDSSGSLFPDDDNGALPDELILDSFSSISITYEFAAEGSDSTQHKSFYAVNSVPLPAAVYLFITGMMGLLTFPLIKKSG
jgi:hypothetical protein